MSLYQVLRVAPGTEQTLSDRWIVMAGDGAGDGSSGDFMPIIRCVEVP